MSAPFHAHPAERKMLPDGNRRAAQRATSLSCSIYTQKTGEDQPLLFFRLINLVYVRIHQPSLITPIGHVPAHAPQLIHTLGSIT